MKADILTLKVLFQKDVRYTIPTFQRPYVWNQEDQWEPLWNDVRNIAEEYIEQLDKAGADGQAIAEARTGKHFMGAVVLQQQFMPAAELEARHVIDGQQRLTTLQLLLDAAQEVFEYDGWPKEAKQLRKLVVNDEDFAETYPDNAFKVWPTLVDQDSFRHAMVNHLSIEGYENAPIVQAHEFFKLQIREWLAENSEVTGNRVQALVTTLMGLLEMVVIDLQPTDDANVIFETLNARGTPLLDSDLIKNSVLHSVGQAGLNVDAIHRQYWQDFDQPWWRAEVQQGRLTRPRIDVYLNYWLAMRTAEEIKSTRFFPQFRRYSEANAGGVTHVVQDIHTIGKSYHELSSISDFSDRGQFLYRWRVMDAGVTTPVILWLFSNRDKLGDQSFGRSLHYMESYLIRRMICRMTTKDYNRLFLELMRELNSNGTQGVDALIGQYLSGQTADARQWPSDSHLREVVISLPLYQLLTRSRLRIVLEAVEEALRSAKAEEAHVARSALTIEHIMPQGWREHWTQGILDEHDQIDVVAAERRDRLVHTIGNLTLVNRPLNAALSNSPWSIKQGELAIHSVLHLNKKLLDGAPDRWDESSIQERGGQIASLLASIWPGPQATVSISAT